MLDPPLTLFCPIVDIQESNLGRNTDLYIGRSAVVSLRCNSLVIFILTGTIELTHPDSVLTDPEDIKVYYQGDFKFHDRIENLGFGDYMKEYVLVFPRFCINSTIFSIISRGVGGLAGPDWRRVRATLDPHFSLDAIREMLPGMTEFLDEWARKLPNLPVTQRDEKNNQFVIKAEQLAFEILPEFITRRLFGDHIDDEVITLSPGFYF